MIQPSFASKHYASAKKRLLHASMAQFFEINFPKTFGPDIRDRIATQLLELIEEQMPPTEHVRSGQCVWNAVAIETRADSSNLRLVPVILTLVDDEDIIRLTKGETSRKVAQDSIARILDEAYQQGALLSMRDIGLLTMHYQSTITQYRQAWENAHGRLLPHPGTLQDMGSCITHKTAIVVKAVYERMDTRRVAQETHHTQKAVDRYLKDFHRVRTCYRHNPDPEYISQVTAMSLYLIMQ